MTEGAEIAIDLAIGGFVGDTPLTLVVVPVIYSLIESLKARISGGDDNGGGAAAHPETSPKNSDGASIPPLKRLE